MQIKKYLFSTLLLGCLLSISSPLAYATLAIPSSTESKLELLLQLQAQLLDLQEQLASYLKYKDHIPLNTVTEIVGPRTVSAGTYTTWTFATKNNDPDNASGLMIEWGDGMTSVSGSGHTYSTPGEYTMVVSNHDGNGQEATLSAKITVTKDQHAGALSPWGNRLVTSAPLIPKNQFRAYFFNTKTFMTTIAPATVSQIYLSYPGTNASGQDEQFDEHTLGAYWVGSFTYAKETTLYFDFTDPQWDVARFIVDGQTLIDTGRVMPTAEARQITLKPGTHIIEIEYYVNWHAGFFRAKIGTVDPAYTDIDSARIEAKKIAGANAVTVQMDQYSSENTETGTIVATIPNTTTAKILDLSSYESVMWDVRGASSRGVKAIIVSSYAGAADVINADTIPIFRTRYYKDN